MDVIATLCSSWSFILIQLVGILSMAAARLPVGRWAKYCWQSLFFVCLLAVGAATMVAVGFGSGNWLSSGTTLSLMAVGSVVDFGRATSSPVI